MRYGVIIILSIGSSFIANAQSFELFGADFNSTLNSSNSIGFDNASVTLNLPLKLKGGLLIQRFSYTANTVKYNSEYFFDTSSIEKFKSIKYSLGFIKKVNDLWMYSIQIAPTISSNFESSITFDDVFLNGSLIFIRTNNTSKLRLGLIYNTGFGMNTPIPVISYSDKITNHFSYTIGMPITKLNYKLSQFDKVTMYIKPKGFYSNLSNNIILNNSLGEVERVKYRTIESGFNYLHSIDDFWKISMNLGYQLYASYNLLNSNDVVYEFDVENNFFIGVNIKYNLTNKKN